MQINSLQVVSEFLGTSWDASSIDVHSANNQANTGLGGPFLFSTYISTYIAKLASAMRERCCRHIITSKSWQLPTDFVARFQRRQAAKGCDPRKMLR